MSRNLEVDLLFSFVLYASYAACNLTKYPKRYWKVAVVMDFNRKHKSSAFSEFSGGLCVEKT